MNDLKKRDQVIQQSNDDDDHDGYTSPDQSGTFEEDGETTLITEEI